MATTNGSNFFSDVNSTLSIALTDQTGLAVLARCLGAAPTTAGIFQHGCLILRVDSGDGVGAMYQNTGTSAVPSWTLVPLSGGGGIPALTSAHIFVGNGGNVATDVAVTGDIGIDNAGVTSITAGAIVNNDINAAAGIAYSKLAALPSANILIGSAGNVATATPVTGDVTINNAAVTAIAAGVIVDADINSGAAIATSKLQGAAPGSLVVADGSNFLQPVAMSGDATLASSGAITIANAAVTKAKLATGISASHITISAGSFTTTAGSATQTIADATILNTDLAFVQMYQQGGTPVTILEAAAIAGGISVLCSADPGNDHVFRYQAIRATV